MPFSIDRRITSYTRVQKLIGRIIRNRAFFINKGAIGKKVLLNVGCGPNIESDYINLDYEWRPGIDVCWDIRKNLPFRSNSLDGIFSEHCLEHVAYKDAVGAASEFYRVLKPGGALRAIVPDGGLYLDLYAQSKLGDAVEFPYVDEQGMKDMAEDSRIKFTSMMAVNRIFRGYGHEFAYDYETLASVLEHVGFADVHKSQFRQGKHQNLMADSEIRAPQSLFVEAIKPA